MKFVAGMDVKLTDKFAAALMKRKTNKTNWAIRRGVVISCNSIYVYVQWAGNKTFETLSVRAVEEVINVGERFL